MKRTILLSLSILLLVGCGNNGSKGSVTFAPKEPQTIVTRRPASKVNPTQFAGKVKLMVVLAEDTEASVAEMLRNRLIQLCATYGMGAIDGAPSIIITPQLVEINHNKTATVPSKEQITYDFTLYVANLATGDVYGSVQQKLVGVGDSATLALRNAVANIPTQSTAVEEMLRKAEEQILAYYNTYGESVLAEAQAYMAAQQLEPAMTLLNSIPQTCTELYQKAMPIKAELLAKSMVAHADECLVKMRAALGTATPDLGGYCPEAMAYYAMIPTSTPARKEADALYTSYVAQLNPEAKQQWDREQRNWEAEQAALKRKHELNIYQEDMAAKIAIDGQKSLLDKYKNDANHSKMGSFWKFFYRGKE
ncbi:MAG: hypothetical protein IKA07_04435 [Alistipes sp.]|nr:hypothetical protein [Alistipes sp.]